MPAIPYHAYNRCLLNLAEEEKCRGLPVASSLRAHLSKLTVATWVLVKASGCSIPQFLEREVYVSLFFLYIFYAAKLRFMLVELVENTIIRIFIKNAVSVDSICISLTHQSHTAVSHGGSVELQGCKTTWKHICSKLWVWVSETRNMERIVMQSKF